MAMEAGGAFICNDNALTEDNQHLWVIVSDPGAYPECVVIVNLSSSSNAGYDPACHLRQGDHWFVKHPSFVYYRRAKVLTSQKLEEADISHKTSVSADVLARIREGAGKTNRLPRNIKQHLIEQGIIQSGEAAGI
jgi:hypothetical protein